MTEAPQPESPQPESTPTQPGDAPPRPRGLGNLINYIRVARLDHWFKNVFVLFGVAAALLFMTSTEPHQEPWVEPAFPLVLENRAALEHQAEGLYVLLDNQPYIGNVLGHWETYVYAAAAFLLTGFIASFNYIINEILDARRDAVHPKKKLRPIPLGLVSRPVLVALAVTLLVAGLGLSLLISTKTTYALGALFVMGLIYNVPPVRTKDLPYLDVITESINNPIRLMIGWYAMVAALYQMRYEGVPYAAYVAEKCNFAPASLLMCWWTLGAFLMTAKRFAEYRFIGSHWRAKAYRRSFHFYSEEKLLVAMIIYVSLFMFSFGVMAIRYNLNLLLSIPLFIVFISWFFHLSFRENSPVKEPEKLLREGKFLAFCLLLFLVLVVLSVVPMKGLWDWVHWILPGDPFHPKSINT